MSDLAIWNNSRRSFQDLDETVEAFEECWNLQGCAELRSFLPPHDHPEFESLSLELLCVDLERRWSRGIVKTISDYRQELPELFARPRILERVAFEEYRLRVQSGQSVEPAEYARRFKLKTDHWSQSRNDQSTDSVACEAFASGIAYEMQRIAGVTHRFPKVGERFLDFDLVEQLGDSNRDSVFLARQATLADRQVVVKFTTEMWHESDRMARLQHTNVVPVYSVHQREGLQAVCMPFLGRHTLASFLRSLPNRTSFTGSDFVGVLRNRAGHTDDVSPRVPDELACKLKRLDFEQICIWIVSRVAKGLSHAHGRGLLHRDLKPSNILITNEGQPMILDFNLAEDSFARNGKSVLVGGTLPYMSPEHVQAIRSDGCIDIRSDVYSLGIILFQMLTGDFPVHMRGGSIIAKLDMLANQRAATAPSIRGVNPNLSHSVDSIVRRCLAADPSQRYQTARELHDDLQCQLQQLPLRHAPNPSRSEVVTKWIRRHKSLTSVSAISAAAMILLTFVVGWLVVRDRVIASGEALNTFRQFEQTVRVARASLSLPMAPEVRGYGLDAAHQALTFYQDELPNWESQRNFRFLNQESQQELRSHLGELHFLISEVTLDRAKKIPNADRGKAVLKESLHHNRLSRHTSAASFAFSSQLAAIHTHLGNQEAATKATETANKLPNDEAREQYMTAVLHATNGRYETAISLLKDLSEIEPQNFSFWFLMGNCHCTIENFSEADACYTTAVALWPEFYVCYLHRGICRLRAKNFVDAETDFAKVLSLKNSHTAALINRAMARIELGRFADAIGDLNCAIDCGRDDSLPFILRSRAWDGLGETDKALSDRTTAIEREPVDVDGWLQRGLLRLSEDRQLALADIESALQLDPDSTKALQNKAHILSYCPDDDEKTIETLSRLLRLQPNDATVLIGLGITRARVGQDELAIHDGNRALQLSPTSGYMYQVARIYAQTSIRNESHADQAVTMLRAAIKRDLQWARVAERDADLKPISSRSDFRELIATAVSLSGTD